MDALRRRVQAEGGLRVQHVQFIGRRIHPKTSRVMVYCHVAVEPGDPQLGDPEDLEEVRWVSIDETTGSRCRTCMAPYACTWTSCSGARDPRPWSAFRRPPRAGRPSRHHQNAISATTSPAAVNRATVHIT